MRVEGRYEHQGVLHKGFDFFLIGLDAVNAALGKAYGAICNEANRLEHIIDDYGLEYVEFKMTV